MSYLLIRDRYCDGQEVRKLLVLIVLVNVDDYAEDGGPGVVCTSSSFNHNPLRR